METVNISFIINLTTAYNMNNHMQWFIPYIQEGKILEFSNMAQPLQFEDETNKYINQAKKKIIVCKNLWHLYLKDKENEWNPRLKIIFVLDTNHTDISQLTESLFNFFNKTFDQNERKLIYCNLVFIDNLSSKSSVENKIDFHKILSNGSLITCDNNNHELIFYYAFNATTKQQFLNTYRKLSIFLCVAIDWFSLANKHNEKRIFSYDSDHSIFAIDEIRLEDNTIEKFLEFYNAILTKAKHEIQNYEAKTIDYKLIDDNISNSLYNGFTIDEQLKSEFLTQKNLLSQVPFFYTLLHYQAHKDELEKDYWKPIEDSIDKKKNDFLKSIYTDNDNTSIHEITLTNKTIADARIQLRDLLSAEKNANISSRINYKSFKEEKIKYDTDISKLHLQYLDTLRELVKFDYVIMFSIIFFSLLFLLLSPIYSFVNIRELYLPFIILSFLVILVGLALLLYFRFRIKVAFDKILHRKHKLWLEYDKYLKTLVDLTLDIYRSQIRRDNIKRLKEIIDQYEEKIQKYSFYIEFISQMDKFNIETNSNSSNYDLALSPFNPVNKFCEFHICDVIITVNDSERNLKSESNGSELIDIGFVKEIKLSTITNSNEN